MAMSPKILDKITNSYKDKKSHYYEFKERFRKYDDAIHRESV